MLNNLTMSLLDLSIVLMLVLVIGILICCIVAGIYIIICCVAEEIQEYRAAHPKSSELETVAPLTYGDIERIFYEQNPNLQHLHSDYRPCGMDSIVIWFETKVGVVVRYDEDNNKFEIIKIDKSENL